MPAFSIRLPDSLHRAAREMAAQDGVSINQFISSALGEKIAALKTVEFLRARAEGADDKDWDEILSLVPDAEPESHDRLPTP